MNKVLLITVSVLAVLASFETNASYCDVCCTEGVVFCPYTTENDVCTAGCGCCNLDTHDVMQSKLKTGYWDCCKKGETVYWNGTKTACCNAKAYKQSATTESCCTGATATNPTHKVVTVEGAPTAGLEMCCAIPKNGNVSAYWSGSSARCCEGVVYKDDSGNYRCLDCLKTTSCLSGEDDCLPELEKQCAACNFEVSADYMGEYVYAYECGGNNYCKTHYGAGTWQKILSTNGRDIDVSSCGGDDYCKAVYGEGSWTKLTGESSNYGYICSTSKACPSGYRWDNSCGCVDGNGNGYGLPYSKEDC